MISRCPFESKALVHNVTFDPFGVGTPDKKLKLIEDFVKCVTMSHASNSYKTVKEVPISWINGRIDMGKFFFRIVSLLDCFLTLVHTVFEGNGERVTRPAAQRAAAQ